MPEPNPLNKPDPSLTAVLTEVLTEVQQLRQDVRGIRDEVRLDVQRMEDRLDAEVKRWDERFFQLSRDTLGFTRTLVTTAAVVAVLIPLLKDVAPLLIEALSGEGL